MLATVGLAALVPDTTKRSGSRIAKSSAFAAMSGNPRPLALYRPALILPCCAR